jgi:hypothetical protein
MGERACSSSRWLAQSQSQIKGTNPALRLTMAAAPKEGPRLSDQPDSAVREHVSGLSELAPPGSGEHPPPSHPEEDERALDLPLTLRVEEMLRRKAAGDYVGAFVLADSIVRERGEHGLARVCLEECSDALRFGNSEAVPRPIMSLAEISRLSLPPRAAFMLSRVDGQRTVDAILELCGIPRGAAIRTMAEFVRRRLLYFPRR